MSDSELPVITEIRGRLGFLTLNRPKGLNALTLEMVDTLQRQLDHWAVDNTIQAVVLAGAGEKAFCAGGDIRALYDSYKGGDTAHQTFFEREYALDLAIHTYPKPVLALMNGIVMGGGMGLSQGASLRVVSDRARLAMPETGIGFFPDVGASYFLGRLPGRLGEYLAVTGQQLGPADALYAGLADLYLPAEAYASLDQALAGADATSTDSLRGALSELAGSAGEAELEQLQGAIDEHFSQPTMPAIRDSLAREQRPDFIAWAEKTLAAIDRHSPLGMAVSVELVRRGRDLTLPQAFALELHLDRQWFDQGDIMEGVRALIVDKDKTPRWQPASLEELDQDRVSVFFDDFRA